ncbi:hypothetical protein HK097_000432 [Rhizophlyctis rosea]|uniref:Anaphase-promoting complex subunit 11 n=1 Tax=Rhizophlyctis rosea TaxID=64517 RepID=A0AAD5S5K7_9FUNG|nr:hypothetical protein HK097_000432 [Rhizophlyctis rosea]
MYQQALLTTELTSLFASAPQPHTQVLANAAVRRAMSSGGDEDFHGGVKRRSVEEDELCQICYETFEDGEEAGGKLEWCRGECGKNFHKDCIKQWKSQCQKDQKPIACPNCRTDWVDEIAKKTSAGGVEYNEEDGYVNLGKLQGMPEERDDSSYSEWMGRSRYRDG